MSFWAKASSGTPTIFVQAQQIFGTGGTPSATTATNLGTTAALSTTWTRYTVTGTIPSASGQTFGTTAGTDYTQLCLYLSNQTASMVQSGTVQFWGVQLEVNAQATPLENIEPTIELAKCQRFYQTGTVQVSGYCAAANNYLCYVYSLPAPTGHPDGDPSFTTQANATGSMAAESNTGVQVVATATGAAQVNVVGTFTAMADL